RHPAGDSAAGGRGKTFWESQAADDGGDREAGDRAETRGVQLVTFPETGWSAVRIVRGGSMFRDKAGQNAQAERSELAEIVTFGNPQAKPVRIMRGEVSGPPRPAA